MAVKVKKKVDPPIPAVPPKEGNIRVTDVVKDGIPFIEVSATDRIVLTQSKKEKVKWNVANFSTKDIDLKVIDFWPARKVSTGQSPGGGTPFKGKAPEMLTVTQIYGNTPGTRSTTPLEGDGDADIVYKYSIAARISGDPNQWFLVKDPELEMDL